MKYFIKGIFLLLCASNFIYPELLVIKKGEQGFVPLDASDEKNKEAIAQVILNYEWPMVIANTNLTDKEKDELLTPNKPYAEEDFIRKKLKEIDELYDVIFIPTTIYELFLISKWSWNEEIEQKARRNEITQENVQSQFDKARVRFYGGHKTHNRTPLNQPNEKKATIYKQFYDQYKRDNNVFFPEAFFEINNELSEKLFLLYPNIHKSGDTIEMAHILERNILKLAMHFIDTWPSRAKNLLMFYEGLENTNELNPKGILVKCISLEYEARLINKALLVRGTIATEESTLEQKELENIATAYKVISSKEVYSISFGNSLFAGYARDAGATAYNFLKERGGYAIFIDKKAYITNNINNLFVISPLAPIGAQFNSGELFHSRTKVPISPKLAKNEGLMNVIGFASEFMPSKDPARVLSVIVDPYVHAELFSQYLADNMRVLSYGDTSNLTEEEKKAYENKVQQEQKQALEAQQKNAQYYKAIRKLEPFATKVSRKYHENPEAVKKAMREYLEKKRLEKKEKRLKLESHGSEIPLVEVP